MPSEETPPNSPIVSSDPELHFDESDVIEIIEDDMENDINSDEDIIDPEVNEGSNIVIEEDNLEEREVIPERDDAQTIFADHMDGVLCCQFHPKLNQIVASGGVDDTAYIWDSTTGNKIFTCKGHEDSVEIVTFSHDGSYLATGDLNGIIKVWRLRDFELIATCELEAELSWMQWHIGTNVLIACSDIGMIYMYKIPSSERKIVMTSFGKRCLTGKVLSDGKTLACGYEDGSLKIVDLKQGLVLKDVKALDNEIGGITCVDVHKSNNLIICGCESGAVILINSHNGKIASVLQGSQNLDGCNYIEAVSFCRDPAYTIAASGSLNGSLIIWDIARQTLRHKHNFNSCVNYLVWHTSLPVLFTCHVEGVAHAFDAKAGVVLKEYLGHRKSCLSMSLSSDGTLLMTTSEDKTARVFPVGDLI